MSPQVPQVGKAGPTGEISISDISMMPSFVPAGTNVNLAFTVTCPEEVAESLSYVISVTDGSGQVVDQQLASAICGVNRVSLRTSGYSSGAYDVNITVSDSSSTVEDRSKFVVSDIDQVPGGGDREGEDRIEIYSLYLSKDTFAPRKGDSTAIIYKLSADAEVFVTIADGKKKVVWAQDYMPGINGGKEGTNAVLWSGLRNRGSKVGGKVPPGIYYISVIATANGKTVSSVTSVVAVSK